MYFYLSLKEDDKFKIYGAGVLSSVDEIQKIIDGRATIRPFDIPTIIQDTPLITEFQANYYSIESYEILKQQIRNYLLNYL